MGSLVFRIAGSGGASYSNAYSVDFERDDGDYLTAASNSVLDIANGGVAFSISMWVKPETRVVSALANKGDNGLILKTDTNGNVTFILGTSTNNIQCLAGADWSNPPLDLGTWVHLVFTYDGSATTGGIKAYVNGSDDDRNHWKSAGFGTGTSTSNSDPFLIGAAKANHGVLAGGNQGTFDGKIDEVSYWGKAISASEVTEIYNSGTPADLAQHSAYDDLTSWYRMGDHASDDLTADSGQVTDAKGSNHLTPKNTTSSNKVEDTPGS